MRLNPTEKFITIQKLAIKEKLVSVCCNLEKNPKNDVFNSTLASAPQKSTKTIEGLEKNSELNQIKNPNLKNAVKKYVDSRWNSSDSPVRYSEISDFELKLQGVKDPKIKGYIEDGLRKLSNCNDLQESTIPQKLSSLDNLLDAYHNAEGNYNSTIGELNGYAWTFSNRVKSGKIWLVSYLEDVANEKTWPWVVDFKKEERLEGLKKYLGETKKDDSKIADYMYQKYYLKNLSPAAKEIHLKILNEFGTKLFYVTNEKAPSLIYEELSQWKKAGGQDFVAPSVIDLSEIRAKFFTGHAAADCNLRNNYIRVDSDCESEINSSLRHEIMHCNDKRWYKDSGLINGINFDDIKENKAYKNEFRNAGLAAHGDSGFDYAYTNKKEFVAVAAEGDFSKYSEAFKQVLAKLGMPEWVFKMEVSNPDIKQEAERIAEIKAKNERYAVLKKGGSGFSSPAK